MKQSSPQITISLTSSNLETSVNEEIFSSPPAFSAKTPKSKLSAVPITNSGYSIFININYLTPL